jgi:hypothetical protein
MRRYFALRLLRYNLPFSLLGVLFLMLGGRQAVAAGQAPALAFAAAALGIFAAIVPTVGFGLSWFLYWRFQWNEACLYYNRGIGRGQLALAAWATSGLVALFSLALVRGVGFL